MSDVYAIAALDTPPAPEAYAQPAETDPWLQRRALGWGASDVGVLLAALGRRPLDWLPSYLQADAKTTNRTHGQPRIIAQKAGLIEPRKRGSAAAQGTAREAELLETWRGLARRGQAGPVAAEIDHNTAEHASLMPREVLPLVDRHCPQLSATPDAWARCRLFGSLGVLECKCSVRAYTAVPAIHVVQVQTQIAVMGAEWGCVIEGAGWSAEWTGGNGPVRTWGDGDGLIVRDDALIAEVREAAEAGWALVERLRNDHGR